MKETYEVMTLRETADFLRVSAPTLDKMIKDHGLPVAEVGHKKLVVKDALMEWLNNGGSANGK